MDGFREVSSAVRRLVREGRHQSRLAALLDLYGGTEDEGVGGLVGSYYARFGRRILIVRSTGLVEARRLRTEAQARGYMQATRVRFQE